MASTLVINPGSSSKKYAFFDGVRPIAEYRFERTAHGFEVCSVRDAGQQTCQSVNRAQYASAITMVLELARVQLAADALPAIVGIRIVAPGSYFQAHRVIDDEFVKRLHDCMAVAPLHIPVMVAEIEAVRRALPDTTIVAVSDSAFHSTLPPVARNYSIPADLAQTHDVYRYGYHGLSVASIVRRTHGVFGADTPRLVVCHIGSGVSVTAVRDGVSVETTMGFSPGSGLVMGTRAGDVDAGALLELMRAHHWRPLDAQTFLQTGGGLVGLTGEADIRSLLDRVAQRDASAIAALEVFRYHIARAIAMSTAALSGVDAVVLTATAAERSPELRAHVLGNLSYLGICVDAERNEQVASRDAIISPYDSPVKVAVMRTDELGEIVRVVSSQTWSLSS